MPRPSFIPKEEHFLQVEHLANMGVTERSIAKLLGITFKTYLTKKKEYPRFQNIIDTANANLEVLYVGILHKNILAGCKASLFFRLKTKFGYSETARADEEEQERDKPSGFVYQLDKKEEPDQQTGT